MFNKAVTLVSLLSAAFLFSGCESTSSTSSNSTTPTTSQDDDHDHGGHDHGEHGHGEHGHEAEGPHSGHILELGDEAYHAEWTHDDKTGQVDVYLLDSDAKEDASIAGANVSITIKMGDNEPKNFELIAVSESDSGSSSHFRITDKSLVESLKIVGKGAKATLHAALGETPYQVAIEAHEGHDGHGHGHSH